MLAFLRGGQGRPGQLRAPKRKRPLRRVIGSAPANVDVAAAAATAAYIGSPEHKDYPSFAGPTGYARSDGSLCPRHLTSSTELTGWIRNAIERGWTSTEWDGGFPRYVWYAHEGDWFEARLSNRELGQYKGYPLDAMEILRLPDLSPEDT